MKFERSVFQNTVHYTQKLEEKETREEKEKEKIHKDQKGVKVF